MTGSINEESPIRESGPVFDLHRRPGPIRHVIELIERLQAPDNPKPGFRRNVRQITRRWYLDSVALVHPDLQRGIRVPYRQ